MFHMIGNLFEAILTKLGNLTEGIPGGFRDVASAVVGLGIVPFASLFGAIGNFFINAICSFMELLACGMVGFFALDIGSGKSTFDLIVGNLDWIFNIVRLLGFSIILIALIAGFSRVLFSPEATEGPIEILGGCCLAFIFVGFAPSVVYQLSRWFNLFYLQILGENHFGHLDFTGFAKAAQVFVKEVNPNANTISAGTQIASVAICFILVFLFAILAVRFTMYTLEFAQRYVVLGVLLLTSPLALSLFATKATRQSFRAWIRMVLSQFILMILSIAFMGIFFRSMSSFSFTLEELQTIPSIQNGDYGGILIVSLWCIAMYALLLIAERTDSYMHTLGVSTVETGKGLASTLNADLSNIFVARTAIRTAGRSVNKIAHNITHRDSEALPADQVIRHDPATHAVTCDSINGIVNSSRQGLVVTGVDAGRGVVSNLTGLSNRVIDEIDVTKCTVGNGFISLASRHASATGEFKAILIPQESGMDGKFSGGRSVLVGESRYIAYAAGPGVLNFYKPSHAAEVQVLKVLYETASNRQLQNITQIKSSIANIPTGAYFMESEPDIRGNKQIYQYVPATTYSADPLLPCSQINVDGEPYWKYEITVPVDNVGGMSTNGRSYIPAEDNAEISRWLSSQFPSLSSEEFEVIEKIDDTVVLQRENTLYAFTPSVLQSITTEGLKHTKDIAHLVSDDEIDFSLVATDYKNISEVIQAFERRDPTEHCVFGDAIGDSAYKYYSSLFMAKGNTVIARAKRITKKGGK